MASAVGVLYDLSLNRKDDSYIRTQRNRTAQVEDQPLHLARLLVRKAEEQEPSEASSFFKISHTLSSTECT